MEKLTNAYVVMFNGPPRSGKDFGAKGLVNTWLGFSALYYEKFSFPLKRSICSWLGYDCDVFGDSALEAIKDKPLPSLGGDSYRQAQIDLSEVYLKNQYGKTIFGDWMAERVRKYSERHTRGDVLVIISDSGFLHEAIPVRDILVDPQRMLVLQVHREGTSFDGDSRSYVDVPGVRTTELVNRGDDTYNPSVLKAVKDWLKDVR